MAPTPKVGIPAKENGDKKETKCFIIAPIGDELSEIRRKSDGLIDAVLKPVLRDFFNIVIAPLDLQQPGSITTQVVTLLLEADLVIANLTDFNPNVMYELAVRHSVRQPVVIITERTPKLPFDVATERMIYYVDDMAGTKELGIRLREAVPAALEDKEIDNPVYRAAQRSIIAKPVGSITVDNYLIDRMDNLENTIVNFINSQTIMNQPISSIMPFNSTATTRISDVTHRFLACIDKLVESGKVRSKRHFALNLGYQPEGISEMMNHRRDAPLGLIEKAITQFNFNPEFLFTGNGPYFTEQV